MAMCLTTKTRIDAETETLIPTHGGGFDVATLHGDDIARTLSARHDGSPCYDRGPNVVAYPINMQIATRHNALGKGTGLGIGLESDPAFTLLRDHHHAVGTHSGVRRLTPRECERLQGFPDDYTLIPHRGKPASDGPRYKALGNSMAVPVMAWIGQRIDLVERLSSTLTEAAA